jgi:hypothetical protein
MPAFEGILCRVTQLMNGSCNALTEFYIKLNRSNAVFVRVHGLPPSSPSFRPHLRWVTFKSAKTHARLRVRGELSQSVLRLLIRELSRLPETAR